MRGDLAPKAMGLGDQVPASPLDCTVRAADYRPSKNSPRGAELDHIRAIFDFFTHSVNHRVDPIGDTFGGVVEFGGQKIAVAVSPTNSQRRTGNLHAGAYDVAGIDGVPQRDVR